MGRPVFLMCRPTFYGVEYRINPWMHVGRPLDRRLALRQWLALRTVLRDGLGAQVLLCRARRRQPDLVFTANAGLVSGAACVLSRFRHPERAGEEPHFGRWFRTHGFRLLTLPGEERFEGAGDALFAGRKLFAGYFYRTDIQAHSWIGTALGLRVFSLELTDPRFYHLDTCFAPIGPAAAVYYPDAFDEYARRVLRANLADLIPVSEGEALRFACNLVAVGKRAVIPQGCPDLAQALRQRGYRVFELDFSEFIKAGGAAKCLTLRLA